MPPLSTIVLLQAQSPGGAQSPGSLLFQMMPFILMFVVIYFLILRPMSKQEKDRKARVDGLKKGDHVVLGGGIIGRISNWEDPKVAVIEIADKVKVRVVKKDIVDARDHVLAEADKDAKGAKNKDGKNKDANKDGDQKGKSA